MLHGMTKLLDAFWRALFYSLMPRVLLLSLTPVLLIGSVAAVLAWFWWDPAVALVRELLQSLPLIAPLTAWLDELSNGLFRAAMGPLVVVMLAAPVLLISALLLVSVLLGPVAVALVADRRFPTLVRRQGGSVWRSLWWSGGSTLLAVVVLLLSLPLWLLPPFGLLLPPLVWGWLSYRVMAFDALAEHASPDERAELLRRHRWPLLAMGLITGYLGAAPSVVWAFGALALPLMPLLVPVFVWLYTLVFALAALWFAHYCLAALHELRNAPIEMPGAPVASGAAPVRELIELSPARPDASAALPPGAPPPGS
jgi:hypothetical protein